MRGVDLVFLRQPRGSHSCGQHCVAMATGGDLARVVKVFGHEWCTQWRDISKALRTLGVRAMPFPASIKQQPKPTQCIVRVRSKLDPGWSHFVIFSHGHWWDPALGTAEGQKRHPQWAPHMYQASYLELVGYDNAVYRSPVAKARIIQEPIYADDWQRLDTCGKNRIAQNVFAVEHSIDRLGQAWTIGKQMASEGYSFAWTDLVKAEGFYCLMDRGEARFVGWGLTYSEALVSASLAATGFLLQRGKSANKFKADESKAKAQAKSHQNLQ